MAVWWILGACVAVLLFLNGSRSVAVAGHDAQVSPTLGRHVVLETGPVLPDVRLESPVWLGVQIELGKTDAESTEELFSRYALIASNVEPQVAQVGRALQELAWSSALRGAAAGSLPVIVYLLLGPGRRREVWEELRGLRPRPVLAVALVVASGVALWQPWWRDEGAVAAEREWIALEEFLGGQVPVPEQARGVELSAGSTTSGTQRLVASAVDTYGKSQVFYDTAVQDAAELAVREPDEDETVVLLVTDRHDNVGMDRVARAVADRAGATAVFGGGDDTSTGRPWEAFSLDSMQETFGDLDRWFVTGNHDHGSFVGDHLADAGWTRLAGEVVEGPAGGRLLGVPDPRSSGLGNWRDETDLSFDEVAEQVADTACAAHDEGERVHTILVHDANLAKVALERGCADLAVGGHTHVPDGPTLVEGENGELGYTWTNGTTGGAAYAIAVGSKPRRDASMTLLTYAEGGRPVGLQLVTLRTNGRFEVADFEELRYPQGV
ncbi:metallophosphoesterase [Nocardioides sp. Y6]|uniref:Metallophosphoesterase n=1 Tax=Nocardioides malaquae TaxID=2773426 RepID=A0ABR9RT39_9ACTN|nr:metallophosphoesterase [Nocardioides malaquae]